MTPTRIAVEEIDPVRRAAWRSAIEHFPGAAIEAHDLRAAEVAVCSPFLPDWTALEEGRIVVLSSSDLVVRRACDCNPQRLWADPDHSDLPLVLAHAIIRARRSDTPTWPLTAPWLRRALLAHVARCSSLTRCGRELVDAWIDLGDHKTIASRLHLSTKAVESRAGGVCRALGVRSLAGLPLGVANTLDSTRLDSTRLDSTRLDSTIEMPSEHASGA